MGYIKGQEVLLGNNWYRVENEDPLIIRKIKLKSINSLRLPIKLEDELYIYRYKQTDRFPMLQVEFGGKDKDKAKLEINADEFISIKSASARGKKISNYKIKKTSWLTPLPFEEEEKQEQANNKENTENEINSPIKDVEDDTKQLDLGL